MEYHSLQESSRFGFGASLLTGVLSSGLLLILPARPLSSLFQVEKGYYARFNLILEASIEHDAPELANSTVIYMKSPPSPSLETSSTRGNTGVVKGVLSTLYSRIFETHGRRYSKKRAARLNKENIETFTIGLRKISAIASLLAGRSTAHIPTFVADLEKLKESDYLITMGCAITKFNPDQYGVESREWDLTNPDGRNMETVREVRDEIESRVNALFDEIERLVEDKRVETDSASGIVGSVRDALSL